MSIIEWDTILLPYEQATNELVLKFQDIRKYYIRTGKPSPIEAVEGRVKSIRSILDKLDKKNIPDKDLETKIEDIAGVRVLCKFVEDIDKVVNIVRERNNFDLKINEERDYISNIKKSGYRSYHILISYPLAMGSEKREVRAEIQIRTITMNFWAGIEHSLRYKYRNVMPEDLQKRLTKAAEAAYQLDKEMGAIREELLEAGRAEERKDNLVFEISMGIKKIYQFGEVEIASKFNKAFMDLYCNKASLKELEYLHEQIRIVIQINNKTHT